MKVGFHAATSVKNLVNLEDSKTDEYGRAVHENCYIWTVVLKKPRRVIVRTEPAEEPLSLPSCTVS